MHEVKLRDPIISFYSGEGTDSCGRRIEEVWQWDNKRLESTHDYIQWLFPLQIKSQFNLDAPILNKKTIKCFKREPFLRLRLKKSLNLMLNFYGLQLIENTNGKVIIERTQTFGIKSRNWLSNKNHNYLRLTRIITSTGTLGMEIFSTALFRCLAEIYKDNPHLIGQETLKFWTEAARKYSFKCSYFYV